MFAEQLGEDTYKITLDRSEVRELPIGGDACDMQRFIRMLLDRLNVEQGIGLPEGRLLVEAFLRSDGSFVFFVSPLERGQSHEKTHYYSCEVTGVEQLHSLCSALASENVYYSIFCGCVPDRYRLVFVDPCQQTQRICSEFGEYDEISALFAAQTDEYLTSVACGSSAEIMHKIFGVD